MLYYDCIGRKSDLTSFCRYSCNFWALAGLAPLFSSFTFQRNTLWTMASGSLINLLFYVLLIISPFSPQIAKACPCLSNSNATKEGELTALIEPRDMHHRSSYLWTVFYFPQSQRLNQLKRYTSGRRKLPAETSHIANSRSIWHLSARNLVQTFEAHYFGSWFCSSSF